MSLQETNVVDAVGIENDTGCAVLTILDSWDWEDESRHLLALQEKLNAYFAFIETGELEIAYPSSIGRPVVVDVITRFPIPSAAVELLRRASEACSPLGVKIRSRFA